MYTCSKCNVRYEVQNKYCSNCGTALSPSVPAGQALNPMAPPAVDVDQRQAYVHVLTVAVPAETAWQAPQAVQLMANLFAVSDLKMHIRATADQIEWGLEVPHYVVEIVQKTIGAQYPAVHIEVQPKTRTYIGYRHYSFEAVQPFVGPLKAAADIRQGMPLATLTGMMGGLGPDEQLLYEVTLTSPSVDYRLLGEQLITESVVSTADYLTLGGALQATNAKMQGADRVDKYRPEDQEILRDKLNRPLAEVSLAIKIKAATEERALKLFLALSVGLELMANEPFNWLYPAEAETYPLVLSPEEAAALWHLPTQGCRAPGIVWADEVTSPYEMFGLPGEFYASATTQAPDPQSLTLEDLEAMAFGDLEDDDDLSPSDAAKNG